MSSFFSAIFFSDGLGSDFSSAVGVGVLEAAGAAGTTFFAESGVPVATTLPAGARRLAASVARKQQVLRHQLLQRADWKSQKCFAKNENKGKLGSL